MRIYLKNIPAKFHPDLIWNDVEPYSFEDGQPNNNNNNNKMSIAILLLSCIIVLMVHIKSEENNIKNTMKTKPYTYNWQ